ncbi:MAG TPA: hypothetical protein RMH99_05820 [Sandaracinaceae bacterium LLY-WYZ-13_1]|nr:hypothetical protein [Sandaracinaceae bacterium LLY-WYZ-13_1]
MDTTSRLGRIATTTLGTLLAAAVWVPSLHLFFDADASEAGRTRVRETLRETQLALWEDEAARASVLARMRGTNAEWDFMGRTFLVLALANDALAHPARRVRDLAVMDRILEETLRLERERGQAHFLMDYVHAGRFVDPSGRSVFVDGEIALMLAARQRVARSERWRGPLARRVAHIEAQMRRGPVTSAESYPDECWTFCNTLALAAVRTSDAVTGEDHGALLGAWVASARAHLIDPDTGMLVSSYRRDGTHLDGPEGSSVFMAAHALQVIDPAFAAEQYALARRHLGADLAGFAWAREWPDGWRGPPDVDSGPVVPLVDASAGASGMALLGAAAFDDGAYRRGLHRSLGLAAFPIRDGGGLRYAASNQVGDAVLLYALSQGPLWRAIGPPPSPANDALATGTRSHPASIRDHGGFGGN